MTSPSIFVNIQAPSSTQLPLQDSPLPNYGGNKVPPRFWIVLFRKPFSFNNKGMLWNFFRKNLCSLREAFLREALLKKETCFLFYKFYKQPLTHPPLPPPSFYKVMLQIFLKFCQKVQKRKIWQKIYWENVHIWHKMLWHIWPQFFFVLSIYVSNGL